VIRVFDPLDFFAEGAQHIPDPGNHLVRYYGWYSNKTRGQRAQRQPTPAGTGIPARSPSAREARFRPQAIDRRLQAKGAANGSFAPSLQPTVCSLQPVEALRAVGGVPGACPAGGADPGHGLRLRARGTGGAVAPRKMCKNHLGSNAIKSSCGRAMTWAAMSLPN
jgi:hypothetical protein